MNEPMSEGPAYGRYEGPQGYSQQQQYETPTYNQAPGGGAYDDNFIEALAQRIALRMGPGSEGKISPTSGRGIPSGMRLALGIVSVGVLVPLSGILIAATSSPAGLLAFGIACAAIVLVNLAFNGVFHTR